MTTMMTTCSLACAAVAAAPYYLPQKAQSSPSYYWRRSDSSSLGDQNPGIPNNNKTNFLYPKVEEHNSEAAGYNNGSENNNFISETTGNCRLYSQ